MTPTLSGGWNFRDVATSTAGAVRPGRLYRSGELTKLDDTGVTQLRDLGITDIADLRTSTEIERHGVDLVPDGVVVHQLPFVEVVIAMEGTAGSDVAPHENAFQKMMTERPDGQSSAEAARAYMTQEYTRFAQAPGAQRAVHRMVALLGDGGTVLTHCFAGKDRTGFGVAVILTAVGVDHDQVLVDFLASNTAVPVLREQIVERIKIRFDGEIPPEAAEFTETRLADDVLGVREEYLDAALRTVAADFGSVEGYLRAAGVTDAEFARLRSTLRD